MHSLHPDYLKHTTWSFYVFLPAKNASLREQVKTPRASDSLRQELAENISVNA